MVASNVIMPLLLAFFLSMLLLPVQRFLKRKRVPNSLSIIIPILFLLLVVAGLIWFFSAQVQILVDDFPQIKKNINIHLNTLSKWVSSFTHYSTKEQIAIISQQSDKLLNSTGAILGSVAGSVSGAFIFFGFTFI